MKFSLNHHLNFSKTEEKFLLLSIKFEIININDFFGFETPGEIVR